MKNILIAGAAVGSLLVAIALPASSAMAQSQTPPPGPHDITWAQLKSLEKDQTSTFTMTGPSGTRSLSPSCSVNTGEIYFRLSGQVYQSGAIGLKPTLKCTVVMPFMSLSTTLYKEVWWGLQFETGPVVTSGSLVQQVQSKNIEQPCLSNSANSTFYAVTTSAMTFPNGSRVSGNVFQETSLPCVTF